MFIFTFSYLIIRVWAWPHTDPKAPIFPEDTYEIPRYTHLKVCVYFTVFPRRLLMHSAMVTMYRSM